MCEALRKRDEAIRKEVEAEFHKREEAIHKEVEAEFKKREETIRAEKDAALAEIRALKQQLLVYRMAE